MVVCFIWNYHIFLKALVELESSSADIRTTLREIFFTGAKEIDAAGKKAICINVPVPQQKTFQKIQASGQHKYKDKTKTIIHSIGEVSKRTGEEVQRSSCCLHCSATHSLQAKEEPEDQTKAA